MGVKKVQTQFTQLLLVLFIFSGVNATLLWTTLDKLFSSYKTALDTNQLTSLVGDLELLLYEENAFRADTEIDSDSRDKRLSDLRHSIKQKFKEASQIVSDNKKKSQQIKNIESEWVRAKTAHANGQVLILVNSFIKTENGQIKKFSDGVEKSAKASVTFLAIYMFLFTSTLVILNQYFKKRVFRPLNNLSEEMAHFELKDNKEFYRMLAIKTFRDDEIGSLEKKFFAMAERVVETVDELKKLDQVKTDFLSLASHELRTPMTAVKGSLSLILSGALDNVDPDTKSLLLISEKETDRLIRLINDILDLTKIEAQKMSLNKKWVRVEDCINEVVQGLKGLYEMTKVQIKIESGDDVEIFADQDRIQQVLTNLLSNAVKFSPKGTTVEVGHNIDGDELSIFVRDHGPGIKESDQSHIFEKFRSQDLDQSRVMKGTGLGLPICKALVEEHGGNIGVKSILGEGSTFYFRLPEFRATESSEQDKVA